MYGSETWPMRAKKMRRMQRTKRMTIRCMCEVTLKDRERVDWDGLGSWRKRMRETGYQHVEIWLL